MEAVKYLLIALVSYLLGSMSLSIYLSRKMYGADVRSKGSGNAGATNMARVYGMMAGVMTLLADALKAVAAMVVGWLLMGDVGLSLAGICCMLGHCFPVFHNFKGGKGVSVGGALSLLLDWRVGLLVIACFLLGAFLSKKVSLGSVLGALAAGIGPFIFSVSQPRMILGIVAMVIVIYRHKENILRLIKGTEPDFKAAKPKAKAREQ